MSSEPELIDITRPQDYKTDEGFEVLFISRRDNKYYPLQAVVKYEDGEIGIHSFTEFGYFSINRGGPNIIKKTELEKDKVEVKEIVERKVVQISTCFNNFSLRLLALCDDGNILIFNEDNTWKKVPKIPQN